MDNHKIKIVLNNMQVLECKTPNLSAALVLCELLTTGKRVMFRSIEVFNRCGDLVATPFKYREKT